jgi:hypothetical protein
LRETSTARSALKAPPLLGRHAWRLATMAGSWLDGGGNGKSVDVVGMMDEPSTKGLMTMVEAGALVSLGTTSDGGALAITVTVDGEWRREYVRSEAELALYLAEAVPAVTDLLAGGRPSAEERGRSRRRKAR